MAETQTDIGEVTVNHYSGTVDDKTRFGVEVVIAGEAMAAEPIEPS